MKSEQTGHTPAITKRGNGRSRRTLCWMLVLTMMFAVALPALAAPPDKTVPRVGQKAGNITALLPLAHIVRGSGKNAVSSDAKKGDEVLWNDLVKTEKGGRARVTLADQSILSLGSQAELRIVKHDAKSQQTALELGYGRLRAEVSTVTRDGGSFTLRTPTAVAGVIGTVFGTDTSIGQTQFLCISGVVNVGSTDPSLGQMNCEPGMAVTVAQGKAPVKRAATTQEIQNFIQETEPAAIQAISPASALAGSSLDAAVTGTHLDGVSNVAIGNSVTGSLNPNPTPTSLGLHLVIQPNAAPGTRVVTFTKANGQTAAAVFTVLAPPGSQPSGVDLTSLKKPYYDIFDQETQSELAALNGIGTTVQQSADGAGQQLTAADQTALQPISMQAASNDLQAPVTDIGNFILVDAQKITAAEQTAKQNLDAALQTALNNLNGRTPGGAPDDQFKADVAAAFNTTNQALLAAFQTVHLEVGNHAQTNNQQIAAALQNWLNQIAQNVPRFDGKELSVDLGSVANFDATKLASNAQSVQWSVCDPSYKPRALGSAIAVSSSGCRAVSGFTSTAPTFTVATCTLQVGDYPVQVLLNSSVAFETMLHVLRPSYDDPATRLVNLASSYSTLKPDMFMSFFDQQAYPGYTVLSENIRNTMQTLSSMQVQVLLNGSPNTVCNDSTMSATWTSNYVFRNTNNVLQQPTEHITVRMHRDLRNGWMIIDFQGDNGTIQAAPPGPQVSDSSLPDLTPIDIGVVVNGTYITGANLAIPGGTTTFGTTIKNIGDAALTTQTTANFAVQVNGTTISATSNVPAIAVGASALVTATINVPSNLVAGTQLLYGVNVNPSNVVQEKRSDNNTIGGTGSAGTIDLKIVGITAGGSLFASLPGSAIVTVQNLGTGNFAGSTSNLKVTSADMPGVSLSLNIPAIGANGAQITVPFTFTPTSVGSHTLTASINPAVSGDLTASNDTATSNVTVGQGFDLKITALNISASLVGGQSGTATVTVMNAGGANFPGQSSALTLTSADFPTLLVATGMPALGAGASANVTINFPVPITTGTHPFTATIASGIVGDTAGAAHVATNTSAIVAPYDLGVTNLTTTGTLVAGGTGNGSVDVFNHGSVSFPGATNVLNITSSDFAGFVVPLNIPVVAAGATVTVPFTFTVPATSGTHPLAATISPITGDTTTAAHTTTSTMSIGVAAVDLQVQPISFTTGGAPPFLSGQSHTLTFDVQNAGNVSSSGADTFQCLLLRNGTTPTSLLGSGTLSAVIPGNHATVTVTFLVPTNFYGADTIQCTVSTDPLESVTTNNSATIAAAVNSNINLAFSPAPVPPTAEQMGNAGTATFTVINNGLDAAPAGWNAVVEYGSTIVGSVLGPALNAGATTTVNVPAPVPQLGPAPQNVTTTVAAIINQNNAFTETSLADNSVSGSIQLVDFSVTPLAGSYTGVAGRSFNVPAVETTTPSPYPFPIDISGSGVPSGLALSLTGGLSGVPSTPGTYSIVLTGTSKGVSHSGVSVGVNVLPEITITPVGTAPTIVPGQQFTVQLNVTGGAGTVVLTPALPTGITGVGTLATSPDGSGNITWTLQASLTVAPGAVSFPVHVSDSGVAASGTPAANFNYTLNYTSSGQADYAITSVSFQGHPAPPYTGSNAIQDGETNTLVVTVANNGNISPTGTINVSATCTPGCTGNSPGSGPAPVAGSSVNITIPLGTMSLTPGTYSGSVTFGAVPTPSITNSFTLPFDVMDFSAVTPVNFPVLNLPVGGSSQVPFTLTVVGTTPLPSIQVTPGATQAAVTFSGYTNPLASGASPTLAVNIAGSVPAGTNDTLHLDGLNNGVTKPIISLPVRYYTASLSPFSGLPNGNTNPYLLPVFSTPPSVPSKVTLQLSGNFDTSQGGANITVTGAPTGVTASLIGNTGVLPGGTFELDLFALTGASGIGTVNLSVSIPETSPAKTVTYQFYVLPQAQADLAITAINPATNFTTVSPWLTGQSATFNVVVQNQGTTPTAGGDQLQFKLNSQTVVALSLTVPALAAGAQTTIPVTLNLPDQPWGSSVNVNALILPSANDQNAANNTLPGGVQIPVADWQLVVTGTGSSDSSPVSLSPTGNITGTSTLNLVVTNAASTLSTPISIFNGAVSPGFSLTFSGGIPFTTVNGSVSMTINAPSLANIAPGNYFVQALGQIGNVQRQATIHILVANSHTADPITLTGTDPSSNTQFISPSTTSPSNPIQVNGPLPEQFTLTPVCSGTCAATPKTDITLTESSGVAVVTTGSAGSANPTQINGFFSALVGSLNTAALQPVENVDGTINPGYNNIVVSLTDMSYTGTAQYRTPSPDPTGATQYNLAVNVGDVVISPSTSCGSIPPTQFLDVAIQVVPINNFNASMSVQWLDGVTTAPLAVLTVNSNAGFTYSGGYTPQTYRFTNPSSSPGGFVPVLMALTFSSKSFPALSTTKYFPLIFDTSTNGANCASLGSTRQSGARMSSGRSAGGAVIRGYYGKQNGTSMLIGRQKLDVGSMPDVRVASTDITFSPSVAKPGDVIEVRFKLRNSGAAANALPVALQVNGKTVARDTFDVAANGSALGALNWDSAKSPTPTRSATAAPKQSTMLREPAYGSGAASVTALTVVIDPDRTVQEASTVGKAAAVAHFRMQSDSGAATPVASGRGDRILMELGEGVCAGFRFASGPSMSCTSTDMTITVKDLGAGLYVLETDQGVADLGMAMATPNLAGARFGMQASAQAGHVYAVQLSGGRIGLLTIRSISNRQQIAAQAQKVFRKTGAVKVVQSMGQTSGINEPGELTGGGINAPMVYIDVSYLVQ